MGDFEKKFPASACRKKKIACSTNVIEKNSCTAVKIYPTHQIVRKKNLADHKSPTPPPPQKLNGRPLSHPAFNPSTPWSDQYINYSNNYNTLSSKQVMMRMKGIVN